MTQTRPSPAGVTALKSHSLKAGGCPFTVAPICQPARGATMASRSAVATTGSTRGSAAGRGSRQAMPARRGRHRRPSGLPSTAGARKPYSGWPPATHGLSLASKVAMVGRGSITLSGAAWASTSASVTV